MANRQLIWSDIVENQQATTNDMRKNFETKLPKQALVTLRKPCILQSRNKRNRRQAASLKMTSLNIDRLLPIYTSIVLLRFEVVDIQN